MMSHESDRKRRSRLAPLLTAIAITACACGAVAAELEYSLATPEATVDSLHGGLVEIAAGGNLDVDARYAALRPLVDATHDIAYIAELTVRRSWPEFDQDQRARFVDAFLELSAMTYAARFADVTESTFERVGADAAGDGRAEVLAMIRREAADDITLDYLLHRNERGWQIINIIADGVSDLALKRSEYRDVLADGTPDELIEYIEDQSAELRSSR